MANMSLEHRHSREIPATVTVTIDKADLIDEKSMIILRLFIMYILQLLIQSLGIGTNIVSIITFIKAGMSDSVSVCFLSLAVSDMGYLVVFMATRLIGMLHAVVKIHTNLPLPVFAYVTSFYGAYFQDVSTFITLYTAIQKCCCVSLPHLFRNIFTTSRSWIYIVVIYVVILVVYIPIFHSVGFRYKFSTVTNSTNLLAFRRFHYKTVIDFWMVFSRIVLVFSTQILLLICLAIMAAKFRQSAKFRDSCTSEEKDAKSSSNEKTEGAKTVQMGFKERRAMAAVVWVSAMYMFSTIPYSIVNFVELTFPPYNSKYLTNLRTLVNNSQTIFYAISASLNFFVYVKYNSKFCLTLYTLFHLKVSGNSSR